MLSSCEFGNEPPGFIKSGEFFLQDESLLAAVERLLCGVSLSQLLLGMTGPV